jgi:hypothetical protein
MKARELLVYSILALGSAWVVGDGLCFGTFFNRSATIPEHRLAKLCGLSCTQYGVQVTCNQSQYCSQYTRQAQNGQPNVCGNGDCSAACSNNTTQYSQAIRGGIQNTANPQPTNCGNQYPNGAVTCQWSAVSNACGCFSNVPPTTTACTLMNWGWTNCKGS